MKSLNRIAEVSLSAAVLAAMTTVSVYAEEPENTAEKEETVYVIADHDGSTEKVIVSDWLKNSENAASLRDFTSLDNVENVKGYETFEKNSDGSIVWAADGSDIYYQGTTSKELPVHVRVSFTLNGKPVTADEIAGQSGHVVIRFDYENDVKESVDVNGQKKDVTVPFGYITGTILDEEVFSNVKITNGRLISDGEKLIAAGFVLPGMKDSLELDALKKDEDIAFEIPEYIEIEADVKDFEMGDTMTVADANLLGELDGESMDFSELTSEIGQLTDAAAQLVDGSSQLHDGVSTLKDGTSELHSGAGKLQEGVQTLRNGTSELHSKSYDLDDGASRLAAGAAQLISGAEAVNTGAGTVRDGAAQLSAGAGVLAEGTGALKDGAGVLCSGAGELASGVGVLKSGADELSAGAQDLRNGVSALRNGFDSPQSEGGASLLQGSAAVANGLGQLNAALQNADTSAAAGLRNAITNAATEAYTDMATAQGMQQAIGTFDESAARSAVESAIVVSRTENTEYGTSVVVSSGTYGLNPHYETFYVPSASTDEDGNEITVYSEITVLVCDDMVTVESTETPTTTTITETVDVSGVLNAADAYANVKAANAKSEQLGEDAQKFGSLYNAIAGDSGSIRTAAETVSQTTAGMLSNLSENVSALAAGASVVDGGINTIYQGTSALQAGADQVAGGAVQIAAGTQNALDGANSLKQGAGSVSAGAEQVNAGAAELKGGADQLAAGTVTLKNGTESLAAGSSELKDGTAVLKDGTAALVEGTGTLNDGAGTLLEGVTVLFDGTSELDEGAAALLDGSQELLEGMLRFDAEGIQKIADLFGDNAERVLDNLKAVAEAGRTYNSFAGSGESESGSVKFIIRTKAIEKKDN